MLQLQLQLFDRRLAAGQHLLCHFAAEDAAGDHQRHRCHLGDLAHLGGRDLHWQVHRARRDELAVDAVGLARRSRGGRGREHRLIIAAEGNERATHLLVPSGLALDLDRVEHRRVCPVERVDQQRDPVAPDAAERRGHRWIGRARRGVHDGIEATERGRATLVAAGIDVIDGEYIDPLKLVILLSSCGADGTKVEADLLAANIDVEMANRDLIIPMITFADTPDRINDLVKKIIASVNEHKSQPRPIEILPAFSIEPEVVVTPRDAFFSSYEVVDSKDAVGRVSAEMICPYPPGVPVLSPGERITEAALSALFKARDMGVRIAFVADPTLQTLKVLPK